MALIRRRVCVVCVHVGVCARCVYTYYALRYSVFTPPYSVVTFILRFSVQFLRFYANCSHALALRRSACTRRPCRMSTLSLCACTFRRLNVSFVSIRHNLEKPCDDFERPVALRLDSLLIEVSAQGHTISQPALYIHIKKNTLNTIYPFIYIFVT